MIPYTITNDTINIILDDKTVVVKRGANNFHPLLDALLSQNWEAVPQHLASPVYSLAEWSKTAEDQKIKGFHLRGSALYYKNRKVPPEVQDRAAAMAAEGEDPMPLFRFFERLARNPSKRSVEQLYGFIAHEGIPLTPEGCFLTYKSVRADYKDHHSGNFDNTPGQILEMPRNEISDDPNHACHEGFHVGALAYVQANYRNGRILICEVDPEHVVCVPYDSSQHKMRVCQYKVIGLHAGGQMSSTTFDHEEEREYVEGPAETDELGSADAHTVGGGKFTKYDNMGPADLLELSIKQLRYYAAAGLLIVGASKVQGGKLGLLELIMSARGY